MIKKINVVMMAIAFMFVASICAQAQGVSDDVLKGDNQLKLDKEKVELLVGEKMTLKVISTAASKDAKLESADKTAKVTWKSSNEKVVTVDANGNIKGVSEGKAVVTASQNGKEAKCDVIVTAAELKLSETKVELPVGKKKTLKVVSDNKAVARNAAATKVEWKSSNEKVVTVDKAGTIFGVSEGKAVITASQNGKEAKCDVIVISTTKTSK